VERGGEGERERQKDMYMMSKDTSTKHIDIFFEEKRVFSPMLVSSLSNFEENCFLYFLIKHLFT